MFDADPIRELRVAANQGVAPSQLIDLVARRSAFKGGQLRVLVIGYFALAFFLPLGDAAIVGTAPLFEHGRHTTAEIDALMQPLIDAERERWLAELC